MPKIKKVDLHTHSIHSLDGEYDVLSLFKISKVEKVNILSISDHNSIKANYEAEKIKDDFDIYYIPAIEIDCTFKGIDFHILGYGIDYKDPFYKELEDNYIISEAEASKYRVERIKELGIEINETRLNKLAREGVITGEMIAEVVLNDVRNNKNELLLPYRERGKRSDNPYVNFYWDYCSQGKFAYSPIEFPSLESIVKKIKETYGVVILAHPGIQVKQDLDLLTELVDAGIEGIEVFSSYHNESLTNLYYEFAVKNELFITCGSDFHGKTKPNIKIGSTYNEKARIAELIIEIANRKFEALDLV